MQARIEQLKNGTHVDILIGCVDTRKARRSINRWTLRSRVLYWLDLGNSASSGQFVLGQPNNSANRKKKVGSDGSRVVSGDRVNHRQRKRSTIL